MSPHRQVWTYVNAPVDEGIAAVVEALSLFRPLRTLESCEGDDETPACVYFTVGDDRGDGWTELAALTLGRIGPSLLREMGDRVRLSVQVTEWGSSRGELLIQPGMAERVAGQLRRIAGER